MRHTRFPDLSPKSNGCNTSTTEHVTVYDGLYLLEKVLIIAWSRLLHLYTGDEDVTFLLDSEDVTVHVSFDLQVERQLGCRSSANDCTGLFFNEVCALLTNIENSSVGLWEIDEMTDGNVKIDAFVNFIKLPDAEEQEHSDGERSVFIEEDQNARRQQRSHVIDMGGEAESKGFIEPKTLEDNGVRGAYIPSIDVEATVRDGSLAVGVFAPETLLNLEEAQDVISSIKTQFEGLLSGEQEHLQS